MTTDTIVNIQVCLAKVFYYFHSVHVSETVFKKIWFKVRLIQRPTIKPDCFNYFQYIAGLIRLTWKTG